MLNLVGASLPYNITVILRSIIHDRSYVHTIYDIMSGLSIILLILKGIPYGG
jgi:hypothetical protein